ncbi:MAG: hypothetical protein ACUVQ5_05035 [Candidatus Methanomethylicaceae archaeon]
MLPEERSKTAALQLRLKIIRILSKLLILIMIVFSGYIIMPYLQQINLILPIINTPLVTLGSVMVLAVVGILLYRILLDTVSLLHPVSRVLQAIFKRMTMDHVTLVKRAVYDILFLIAMLIVLTIFLPLVGSFPVVGIYLATGLPLMALAIAILIFWDLGKILYNEVEQIAEIIAEKIESLNEE